MAEIASGTTSLLKQSYLYQDAQDHVQMAFNISKDADSTAISGQTTPMFSNPHSKKAVPDVQTASVFPCYHCLLSCHWTPLGRLCCHLLYFAIKYLYTSIRSSTHLKPSLLNTKQTQLLVSPTDAPTPSSPSWPSISHLCLQNTQQVSSSMKARKLLF